MSVKIFLPTEIFYTKENCDIYGEVQINDNNAISYFVISYSNAGCEYSSEAAEMCERLRHLGHIVRAGPSPDSAKEMERREASLCFAYDQDTPNIYLVKLSIKPPQTTHVNVFLYDVSKMLQLHDDTTVRAVRQQAKRCSGDSHGGGDGEAGDYSAEQCDDVRLLYRLLRQRQCDGRKQRPSLYSLAGNVLNMPLDLITYVFVMLLERQLVVLVLQPTVLYEHYREWRMLRSTGKRSANIALDKLLGICVMLLLLFYISHPGDYLLQTSHLVIQKLRLLLHGLKGSPIGLKLNVHLNNFFLDCFNYHVDLWAKFLDLIEPLVRQLFLPIALSGVMGLSYQLALLADLISLMGLHAHCFYIYAAALYKVEIKGIQVLWKVVLGKRYNVVKNRVESHNYMNRQLYLATLFFTSLLFLFPTILVYYVVFTTLRLCIYLVNLLLQVQRRRILEFPLQSLCKWLAGHFYDMESIQLQHVHHVPSPLLQPDTTQVRMSVFKVNVLSSSLGRLFSCESAVLQEFTAHEQTSLKTIFNRILKGQF